jgi:hypoxanthine phosphoribosyltransferase
VSSTVLKHGSADADEVLSASEIDAGFDSLAIHLQPIIEAEDCVLLGILNGGMFPLVHLAERLQGDFIVDYCHATRYEGGTEGQELAWLQRPHVDMANRTIIVVDDIFDEGTTLRAAAEHCRQEGAAQVYTAVMLVKDRERDPEIPLPDYVTGLTVPDRYVFGCGMDLYGRWRHLTAVYALRGNTGREER